MNIGLLLLRLVFGLVMAALALRNSSAGSADTGSPAQAASSVARLPTRQDLRVPRRPRQFGGGLLGFRIPRSHRTGHRSLRDDCGRRLGALRQGLVRNGGWLQCRCCTPRRLSRSRSGPGRYSLDAIIGLTTTSRSHDALAIGIIGAFANLALRRPASRRVRIRASAREIASTLHAPAPATIR